ncbi:MAG: hypothetical protein JSW68_15425, partial [Burkholderiales bacterium]
KRFLFGGSGRRRQDLRARDLTPRSRTKDGPMRSACRRLLPLSLVAALAMLSPCQPAAANPMSDYGARPRADVGRAPQLARGDEVGIGPSTTTGTAFGAGSLVPANPTGSPGGTAPLSADGMRATDLSGRSHPLTVTFATAGDTTIAELRALEALPSCIGCLMELGTLEREEGRLPDWLRQLPFGFGGSLSPSVAWTVFYSLPLLTLALVLAGFVIAYNRKGRERRTRRGRSRSRATSGSRTRSGSRSRSRTHASSRRVVARALEQ